MFFEGRIRMIKNMVSLVAVSMAIGCLAGEKGYAAEELQNFQNPPYQEINRMLTEAALEKDIPPEIVKAVALQESSWDHFVNGAPNNVNGGIGLMQVTNDLRFDQERLGSDIRYNIEAGLYILDEKFKDVELPALNDMNRDVLENWYFALLAYNAKVQKNSPVYRANGSTNTLAYQEKLFKLLHDQNGEMGVYPLPFKFKVEDFTYDPAGSRLYFNKEEYIVPDHLLHVTKHKFEKDDIVLSAEGAKFRNAPSTGSSSIGKVPQGEREAITILESSENGKAVPFLYDESYNYRTDKDPVDLMRYRHPVWYKALLNDGKTTAYTASGELIPLGKRLYGFDRMETAAAVSREGWESADTVVIAFGYDFPDALAGTPLAYHLDAPLLLSYYDSLRDATKKEIKRLGAKNAVLLGSSELIKPTVEQELSDLGIKTITRYGGADRFETAAKIAQQLPKKDTAILAFGFNFPDALSIASYAAQNGYPIYLTRDTGIPDVTANELKNYENIIVVGDKQLLPDSLLSKISPKQIIRYGGKSRFDTNAAIVNGLYDGIDQAYIARGYEFPDALTGAVLAAKQGVPILLSNDTNVPPSIRSTILEQKIDYFGFLGGQDVLDVQNEIGQIVQEINY
jgi:putative cell wall-binding protein